VDVEEGCAEHHALVSLKEQQQDLEASMGAIADKVKIVFDWLKSGRTKQVQFLCGDAWVNSFGNKPDWTSNGPYRLTDAAEEFNMDRFMVGVSAYTPNGDRAEFLYLEGPDVYVRVEGVRGPLRYNLAGVCSLTGGNSLDLIRMEE
jgi:hypothetical protein